MEYEEFVRGCNLGVFPSYYEPWGYTPGIILNVYIQHRPACDVRSKTRLRFLVVILSGYNTTMLTLLLINRSCLWSVFEQDAGHCQAAIMNYSWPASGNNRRACWRGGRVGTFNEMATYMSPSILPLSQLSVGPRPINGSLGPHMSLHT